MAVVGHLLMLFSFLDSNLSGGAGFPGILKCFASYEGLEI